MREDDFSLAAYPRQIGDSALCVLDRLEGTGDDNGLAARAAWHLAGYALGQARTVKEPLPAGTGATLNVVEPLDAAGLRARLADLVADSKGQRRTVGGGPGGAYPWTQLAVSMLPLIHLWQAGQPPVRSAEKAAPPAPLPKLSLGEDEDGGGLAKPQEDDEP